MLITDKILSLFGQLKFRDDTSELEIQNNKLKKEVGELKIKNDNQSMNLVALRASSKTEIKKLKYQLHMANNRIQVLDAELQQRKFDAYHTIKSTNSK